MARWLVIWYDDRYNRYQEDFFDTYEKAWYYWEKLKNLYPGKVIECYMKV